MTAGKSPPWTQRKIFSNDPRDSVSSPRLVSSHPQLELVPCYWALVQSSSGFSQVGEKTTERAGVLQRLWKEEVQRFVSWSGSQGPSREGGGRGTHVDGHMLRTHLGPTPYRWSCQPGPTHTGHTQAWVVTLLPQKLEHTFLPNLAPALPTGSVSEKMFLIK